MSERIVPAVKALILNEGKILLLKKEKSRWKGFDWNDIPGGKMEFGETNPLEALKREVREEVNMEVEVIRPVHMVTIIKTEDIHIVGTVFACTSRKADGIKLSEEHESYRWLTKKEILEGNIPPWIKDSVRRLGE